MGIEEDVKTESPVRYEIDDCTPSFFDYLRGNKPNEPTSKVYHFECPLNPREGTFGANPKNIGNYLRNIKQKDSLIFHVDAKRIAELGAKGVEYEGEVEKIIERIERKSETVYLTLR